MRLKQIKLAGFKSFVDATKIPFKEQMTAIVGPNGCGKSNIIDAVRWVLGESSAKNLRGDAMTDVIFNGSSSRKPIGQASVELFFENTQGKLQGSLADRNEISIRRVVTRDAISNYYLNGTKCRRRDITDIFLGTGLGPRSYAIIEQGTISRLIESKPQELRVFIEEAAGISKYKEQRRDTENRIRHTRENLERLTDIIAELTHQLDKLHQQAEAAKRFKALKERERKYKAELSAMRWQQFEQKAEQCQQQIKTKQVSVESLLMKQRQTELELLKIQQKQTEATNKLGEYQQQKLILSNDITRLEQTIKHKKQQQLIEQQQLQSLKAEQQKLQQSLQQAKENYSQITQLLAEQTPELELVTLQLEQSQFSLQEQQDELQQCLLQWQQVNHSVSKNREQLALLDMKKQSQQKLVEQTIQSLQQSEVALEQLKEKISSQPCKDIMLELELLKQEYQTKQKQQQAVVAALTIKQDEYQQIKQKLLTKKAQLPTLEQALTQLEQQHKQLPNWLKTQQHFVKNNTEVSLLGQVYQQVTVDSAWQDAVTLVLGQWLSAELIDNVENLVNQKSLPSTFLFVQQAEPQVYQAPKGTLAEMVTGNYFILQQLSKIYCADDLAQAQQLLTELADDESVICQDGTWLGHHFLRRGMINSQQNLLQQQRQIISLKAQQTELIHAIEDNQKQLVMVEQQVNKQQLQQSLQDEILAELAEKIQQKQQDLALAEQTQQHIKQQFAQVEQQNLKYQQTLLEQQQIQQMLNADYQQQLTSLQEDDQQQLQQLEQKKEQLQQQILTLQAMNQQFQQQYHQLSLQIEKAKAQQENSQEKVQLILSQQTDIAEKIEILQQPCKANIEVLNNEQHQLQQALLQMSALEKKIISKQNYLAQAQENTNQLQQQNTRYTKEVAQLKENINEIYLRRENYHLRAQTALEQLIEMRYEIDDVLANIPEEAKETTWQGQITRISKEIAQLGAINLAAISEYDQELTRKRFLDQQYQDINAAINTLEMAIAKIDRQSRQKFKTTFEKINSDFKQLFPHVFGGGNAYLALTGDDLLETGVTIMARPPGKKNSTIHLLSGGEKALTALSLVFAIFRLNPAPFCMLDEVDAPLDDANVVRFCNLVREMSQSVQFIYISHNKIAMEMASHLAGVTMFEPGVSRMVTVDIDEAVAMAELSS